MILELPLINNMAHECMEDEVASAMEWMGREWALSFIDSWAFSFSFSIPNEKGKIGKKLSACPGEWMPFIEKYHGVKIQIIKPSDINEAVEIFESNLKKSKPVLGLIDGYWCPWNKYNFMKFSADHYTLYTGIDRNKKVLYCLDAGLAKTRMELSYEYFLNGSKELLVFNLEKIPVINWRDVLIDVTRNMHTRFLKKEPFNEMLSLAKVIETDIDLAEEVKEYPNIWHARFFSELRHLEMGRKKISNSLDWLGKKEAMDDIVELGKRFAIAGFRWEGIKYLLIRTFFSKEKSDLKKASANKVRDIVDFEKTLYSDIKKILRGWKIKNVSHLYNTKKLEHFKTLHIDIKHLFNNKAFGISPGNSLGADIGGSGEFFLRGNIKHNEQWSQPNVDYFFPLLDDNKPDNISCNGQMIKVPPAKYSFAGVLATGIWGNQLDDCKFIYEDNTEEVFTLKVSDWAARIPAFQGESIAWRGEAVYIVSYSELKVAPEPVFIYSSVYDLNNSKVLTAILLPQCSTIHIFALSLGQSS